MIRGRIFAACRSGASRGLGAVAVPARRSGRGHGAAAWWWCGVARCAWRDRLGMRAVAGSPQAGNHAAGGAAAGGAAAGALPWGAPPWGVLPRGGPVPRNPALRKGAMGAAPIEGEGAALIEKVFSGQAVAAWRVAMGSASLRSGCGVWRNPGCQRFSPVTNSTSRIQRREFNVADSAALSRRRRYRRYPADRQRCRAGSLRHRRRRNRPHTSRACRAASPPCR